MVKNKTKLNQKFQVWVDARRRHDLTHAHVQMARELGMNPKTLGKLDNHDQEQWKLPLKLFIERLYFKSFGRERPEVVRSIVGLSRLKQKKKALKRKKKLQARQIEAENLPR